MVCSVETANQSVVVAMIGSQNSTQQISDSESLTHSFLVQNQTVRRVSLGYIESSRLAWSHGKTLS